MSKASKTRAREARAKQKRNIKAANRAKYAAMRDAGENQKTGRSGVRSRKSGSLRLKGSHPLGACGNTGCGRCFPQYK